MRIQIDTGEFARIVAKERLFTVGDRVKIYAGVSYGGMYSGCEGTIARLPYGAEQLLASQTNVLTHIGVKIDGRRNENSRYDCYWFTPDEIQNQINKENNKMLLLKGYKIAQVATESYGDQYVAHYEETLEEGDRVVVANDEGYYCGIVSNVFTEACMNRIPKFQIVCKIDDSAFCVRIDRAKKAKELEGKLKTAVADYQQIALYEMLAEKSPEIAALLKELKEVTNG